MTIYNPTLRLESFQKLVIGDEHFVIKERAGQDEFLLEWDNGAYSAKMHIDKISQMIHDADEVKLVAE